MRLKVLICDDEIKVCRLIAHLADWQTLEMDLVGFAQSGAEALEMIVREGPDLVITDVRMPGYTGLELISLAKAQRPELEFIVISGYRQFEYAKSAMQFSAVDYLLKPINRKELNAALDKAKNRVLQRSMLTKAAGMAGSRVLQTLLKGDVAPLRTWTAEAANAEFGIPCQPGAFRFLELKLDGPSAQTLEQTMPVVVERLLKFCDNELHPITYTAQLHCEKAVAYFLLNYAPTAWKVLGAALRQLQRELSEWLGAVQELRLTLVVGPEETILTKQALIRTQEIARQRLLLPCQAVIDTMPLQWTPVQALPAAATLQRELTRHVVSLNGAGVTASVDSFYRALAETRSLSGQNVYAFSQHICRFFLCQLRENDLEVGNEEDFYNSFATAAENCNSLQSLLAMMEDHFRTELEAMAGRRKQAQTKPVRLAKTYMQSHYAAQLTLEQVANQAGFNPTYFCGVFKKETGRTFSEYLTDVRITHAKQLLRETDLKVLDVCLAVGYCDGKHFTKCFQKGTGLKPNEFRKLYRRAAP